MKKEGKSILTVLHLGPLLVVLQLQSHQVSNYHTMAAHPEAQSTMTSPVMIRKNNTSACVNLFRFFIAKFSYRRKWVEKEEHSTSRQ